MIAEDLEITLDLGHMKILDAWSDISHAYPWRSSM